MSQLLHSKILGKGTPLIILHGFLGMSDNWKTLGNQYAQSGFEVHLTDIRNHGRSFHSPHFTYEHIMSDLEYYMKYYHLSNAAVLGHSMGGKAAMFFATQFPEKVNKLLVADIAPKYYPVHHQTILEGLNTLHLNQIQNRNEANEQLSLYIPDYGTRQFLLKNLYRVDKDNFGFRFNLETLTKTIDNIGVSLPDTFTYKGPALFLRGEKSDYIVEQDQYVIQKHFPEARIETIKSAGHWLHAENPADFLTTSLKFFK
ncbi:alpha/beta fold hydrolase [Ascidiimonas aurantiaca]|uniref:alpha/beta fold hydrolase n=1 Tax=Ascidiimonas aurantiaca TaxID=1685432 RepID=UPI0030ED1994